VLSPCWWLQGSPLTWRTGQTTEWHASAGRDSFSFRDVVRSRHGAERLKQISAASSHALLDRIAAVYSRSLDALEAE
jgi:hypothetical protein